MSELIKLLKSRIAGKDNEILFAVFLNAKNEVLQLNEFGEGTIGHANAYPRRIVEEGLKLKATSLILAHNHPGGVAEPGNDDVAITDEIKKALALVEISLQDHIILADNDYYSFKRNGIII